MSTELTAGHTVTPAMEADVLTESVAVVAPVAIERDMAAEVSTLIASVIRNEFSLASFGADVRAAAATRLRADVAAMNAKPAFAGKKAAIAHAWKLIGKIEA